MNYLAHFKDGSRPSPVTDIRHSGQFFTGLAHRDDGKARCIFFDRHGNLHADRWVSRVEPAHACEAYRAPQLVHVRPSKSVVA